MSALESLNNAIGQLARVSGRGSDAAELASDWSEWFFADRWRSMGPAGLPMVYGAARGFWDRYEALHGSLTPSERRLVPQPDAVEPTVLRLLGQAGAQAVEANEAAVETARQAARDGTAAVLEVADEVERRAVRGTWLVLLPLLLGVFLARRG